MLAFKLDENLGTRGASCLGAYGYDVSPLQVREYAALIDPPES